MVPASQLVAIRDTPYRFHAEAKQVQRLEAGRWLEEKDAEIAARVLRILNDGYGPEGD